MPMRYTKIYHDVRVQAKLDMLSYCILDLIYRLQNSNNSRYRTWCYMSQEEIAKDFGCTSKTVANKIKKLINEGWLESKSENSTFLKRTTAKYQQEIISYQSEKSSDSNRKKVPIQSEKSSYSDRKKVPIQQEKSSSNNREHKEYINNIEKTPETTTSTDTNFTPALQMVTAKKEIEKHYPIDQLHNLFCSMVRPAKKEIVEQAVASFILKYDFNRYPIFNKEQLQQKLFFWIANQKPEYTQTETKTKSNRFETDPEELERLENDPNSFITVFK